jgi:hypothetical protein
MTTEMAGTEFLSMRAPPVPAPRVAGKDAVVEAWARGG